MCLDSHAMRSYAAYKGWQTRRRSEAEPSTAPPLKGGVRSPASVAATIPPRLAARRRLPPRTRLQRTADFSVTADSA